MDQFLDQPALWPEGNNVHDWMREHQTRNQPGSAMRSAAAVDATARKSHRPARRTWRRTDLVASPPRPIKGATEPRKTASCTRRNHGQPRRQPACQRPGRERPAHPPPPRLWPKRLAGKLSSADLEKTIQVPLPWANARRKQEITARQIPRRSPPTPFRRPRPCPAKRLPALRAAEWEALTPPQSDETRNVPTIYT